ncbi:MAG: glycosyltransferase family 4 protein [Clostridia bacterium]|nr:glycosyltransferase family 4 protein [Clostridia bacterium]
MIKLIEVSSDTNIGGAGKCLLTLAKEYDRENFDMTVVLPKNSLLKPHLDSLGVKVVEIDAIADKSLDLSAISKLTSLFRKLQPDIVHTHASMSARIAAKLVGAKIVYTRHSVFPPPASISKGFGRVINGVINNFLSDEIIAVAEAAKENLIATGVSEKKITVILNGVQGLSPATVEEKDRLFERFGIKKGQKVVSIIARLEDIKGHDYFIDAADILLSRGLDVKFFIAGTGSYEKHLKEKVQSMGLTENVVFTGFLQDVESLMNITDVQVNASFGTEATSLALLEGMSLGIPAVVSDFGGNPGVIKNGENGFVVPKQNSSELADAIFKLLSDDNIYSNMKKRAIDIFNNVFTSEKMTRNTEKLYMQVLNG